MGLQKGKQDHHPTTMVFLLLTVLFLHTTHSSVQPPRLEQTKANILSIECRTPYYTAWMKGWKTPYAELQILFRHTSAYSRVEVVANLTSSKRNTKPAIYGRFKNMDMLKAKSIRVPEASEGCESCRILSVRMPVSGSEYHGYYFCESRIGEGTPKDPRVSYTFLVNEQFIAASETGVNGTLTLQTIKADEIKITWDNRLDQTSRPGKVIVERTVVDKQGRPMHEGGSTILFETVNNRAVPPPENHETLLYRYITPDPDSEEHRTMVRLFVQSGGTFCFPDWRYSCEVARHKCVMVTTTHSQPLHTSDSSESNCNTYTIPLGCILGLLLIAVVILVVCLLLARTKLQKIRNFLKESEQARERLNQQNNDTQETLQRLRNELAGGAVPPRANYSASRKDATGLRRQEVGGTEGQVYQRESAGTQRGTSSLNSNPKRRANRGQTNWEELERDLQVEGRGDAESIKESAQPSYETQL